MASTPLRGMATLSVIGFLSLSPARAQDATQDDLRSLLDRYARHWDVPGLVVSVVKNDLVVFQHGYGTTLYQGGTEVGATTPLAVQSISKPITAIALSMLVQEGRVAWDDPIKKYIPEFRFADPYVTDHATLLDAMCHRIGLPQMIDDSSPEDFSVQDFIDAIGTAEPAIPFRSGFYYSNVGPGLLGEVIHRVSGVTWEEFVQVRLLDALGMSDSYASDRLFSERVGDLDDMDRLMKIVALSEGEPTNQPWEYFNEWMWPAGGVISTAEDQAKLIRFLLDRGEVDGRRLLDAALIDTLFSPNEVSPNGSIVPRIPLINPSSHFVALGPGFQLSDFRGRLVAEHGGEGRSTTVLAIMPEERLGVFVGSNAPFGLESVRMIMAVKLALFEHFLGLAPTDWIAVYDR